jgi:hypothetical protein
MLHKGDPVTIVDEKSAFHGRPGIVVSDTYLIAFAGDDGKTLDEPVSVKDWQIAEAE